MSLGWFLVEDVLTLYFLSAGLANGGISEDGFLPSDRRTGRKGKRHKHSSKLVNGKCQTMSSEKESNDVVSPHIEGHLKEQDIFQYTPGTISGKPFTLTSISSLVLCCLLLLVFFY